MPPVEIVQSIPLTLSNDAETQPYPVQGTVAVGNWPQFRVSYRHLNGKYVRDRLLQSSVPQVGQYWTSANPFAHADYDVYRVEKVLLYKVEGDENEFLVILSDGADKWPAAHNP